MKIAIKLAKDSAANLVVIRHIALNLIKAEKTSKVEVKIKRLKAGWDNDYLLRIIWCNLSAIDLSTLLKLSEPSKPMT
jgi:hypothetical protein